MQVRVPRREVLVLVLHLELLEPHGSHGIGQVLHFDVPEKWQLLQLLGVGH